MFKVLEFNSNLNYNFYNLSQRFKFQQNVLTDIAKLIGLSKAS